MANKKNGRPTIFTDELAHKICKLRESGMSLKKICERDDMPHRSTVHAWLIETNKRAFSDNYARACLVNADNIFDELIELADNCGEDYCAQSKARLKIDTRKWILSKMNPKVYGDKIHQEHTGADGGPIQSKCIGINANMDPKEAAKLYSETIKDF